MADHIQSWMISWEVFRVGSLQVVIGLFLAGIEEKSLAIKQAKGAFRWAHVEQLEIQKRGSGVCVCACVLWNLKFQNSIKPHLQLLHIFI